ncbi:MAG TPA: PDZ domain-containing protein [Polyangiaceae bacterium]
MLGTKALRGMYAFAVLGSTALVAYLQALGANNLVEASLMLPLLQPPPSPPLAPPDPAPISAPPTPERPSVARPTLVFAGAPACAGLELKIASQAADPLASRATVRHAGDASGTLLQSGSVFDDMHLLHVGYDGVGVTPVAWFLRDEVVCQLRMFSRAGPASGAREDRATGPAEQAPTSQQREITRLGPGSFQIDRALVDRLLVAPGATQDAYAGFERGPSGTFALKFRRIRPGGWAHTLGLRVGDRLTSVNGYELKDPRHAIEAYAALRTRSDLTLELERAGKVETVQIAIR